MRQGKKQSAEEIVNLLRQVKMDLANNKILPQTREKGEIVEQTSYRGGLKVNQRQGLKELEQENAKLERLVSELSLKVALKCFPAPQGRYVFRFIVTLICLGIATSSRAQSVQREGGQDEEDKGRVVGGLVGGDLVLTQVISHYYYPPGATDFSVPATKFGYSSTREVAFTSIREFYPDIAAHYIRKHREKAGRLDARDAASAP
jgi:hypothetical protein